MEATVERSEVVEISCGNFYITNGNLYHLISTEFNNRWPDYITNNPRELDDLYAVLKKREELKAVK